MSVIVDRGILGGEPEIIWSTGIEMVIIMLIGLAGGLLSIYCAGRVAFGLGHDLRIVVYSHVNKISIADVSRIGTSSLITRLSDDIYRVVQVVQASMRLIFRAPFLFLGSFIMALSIDTSVSTLLIFVMIASFLLVRILVKKAVPIIMQQQKNRDNFVGAVHEILQGMRIVKGFNNEDGENNKYRSANKALDDSTIHVGNIMASMMPLFGFILNVGTILVIYIGAKHVSTGSIQVGGIMALINYLVQIQMSLMMATQLIMNITQSRASIARIEEVLNLPSEDDKDKALNLPLLNLPYKSGSLKFQNVSFAYPDAPNKNILSRVSFSINQGETLAVLGETGSGKSTLISLITRFADPTNGTISIADTDIRSINRNALRHNIGYVMQRPQLFAGSIADNLRMANPQASENEMLQACQKAQLSDFISSHPEGLNYHIEQGGANLSGGQRQRLSIARALVLNPDILILDDSLSALDMATEARLKSELDHLPCTKIIVTQRISSIRNANKILLLRAGAVDALGSHDELMAASPTYRDTYNAQIGIL